MMTRYTKAVFAILITLLMVYGLTPTEQTEAAGEWQLTFEDNFDGTTLDTNKWNYDTGNGFYDGDTFISGWGNEELEYYQEDNVRLEDGQLIIEGKEESVTDETGTYDYTSGKIHTKGKFSQTYGRFEAKMSLPAGQGYWPAFWMMPENDVYGTWAASGEIDIMENSGSHPNKIGGAIHYGAKWPNNTYTAKDYLFPAGQDITDMNVYAVEWEPGEIRWYVNDQLFQTLNNWSTTDEDLATKYAYPAPFDQDFYMILNLAIGGWYGGAPDDTTTFPGEMVVDYVRVYERAGENYPAPTEPEFEAEPLPEGEKAAIDGNYVYDPTYAEGFTNLKTNDDVSQHWTERDWNFLHLEDFGGDGSVSVDTIDGVPFAKVDIANPGNQTYSIQMIQNVTVGKGRWYKLSFDAKSTEDRDINIKIGGGADRGYVAYSPNANYALSDTVESHDVVFQMQQDSDTRARLEFNLGTNVQPVWIGNVALEEVEPVDVFNENDPKKPLPNGNHVYNGTFDLGKINRMTYWTFDVLSGHATGAVNEATRMFTASITDGGTKADDLQLHQTGLDLRANDEYALTFDAKATATRTISVAVMNDASDITYLENQSVELTETVDTKTVNFTMPDVSDNQGKLVFLLGGDDPAVTIDNVFLKRITNNSAALTVEEAFPLTNGTFNLGLDKWSIHNQGDHEPSSEASVSVVDGKFVANVMDNGTEPWHIMLMQNDLTLLGDHRYELMFDVSSTLERQIDVSIENASYHRYFSEIITVGPETETFSYQFDMTKTDTVGLKYLLGAIAGAANLDAHEVTIDNVRLEVVGEREKKFLLSNPDFDHGLTDWTEHVQGVYGDNSSDATFTVEDKMVKASVSDTGENPWDISFSQEGKTVEAGKTYLVQFDAYATTNRKIELVVDNGAPSYHRYLSEEIDLTNNFDTYSFEMTMEAADVVGLKFLMGAIGEVANSHDIFIDNVRFEEVGVREYLYGSDILAVTDQAVEAVGENDALTISFVDQEYMKTVTLTANQLEALKAKNATIIVKRKDVMVEIPSANLSGDTTIEVVPNEASDLTYTNEALSEIYTFSITANGEAMTAFEAAVKLSFLVDHADMNPANLAVYYFNPETKMWENVEGSYEDGYVSTDVTHFSTYAVFSETTFDTTGDNSTGDNTTGDNLSGDDTTGDNTTGNNSTGDDTTGDNPTEDNTTDEDKEVGAVLPDTATPLYNLLVLGLILLLVGSGVYVYSKRLI
ncbi:carbohydrate binding protein [Streptohalobacillus salinus]|uniref:Carbohydrate binding protein n=1 Tax=Streptohalobacillus salinus TaxID=621096 RepID=A0A2V3WFG4_9BACI|nr:carbohydrate binding domain-containing protein [Streptohalobacillus salinus]PXW90955.1 carbohydrate binding protein [Streptohalobacillus salinus]